MPKEARAEARATLAAWQDARLGTPFGNAKSPHAVDRASVLLTNARSILMMLSVAYDDAGSLMTKNMISEVDASGSHIMAGALDGVADLIALASFMVEE